MIPRVDFPTFRPGSDESDQSASQMNRMSDASWRAGNLLPGAGAQISRGPSGNVISVDPTRPTPILSTTRFVAVVAAPTKVDTTVMVRDVVYGVENPEPVDLDTNEEDEIHDFVKGEYTYRWGSSSRIEAIPGVGYVPMDFAGSVFEDVDDNSNEIEPTAETPIFWMEMRGQGPPLVLPLNAARVRQFKITGYSDEFLICRTFDGKSTGDTDVYVARPWDLRLLQTPVFLDGNTYTYVNAQERTARNNETGQIETQVIIKRYRSGHVINADRVTPGEFDSDALNALGVSWLDKNNGARAWAEKNEQAG